MTDTKKEIQQRILAIVGGGPRGLSALESMYGCLSSSGNFKAIRTILFEKEELPGAGPVYSLEQLDTNWLNVSERGLTIPPRVEIHNESIVIPPFASYQNWAGYNVSKTNKQERDKFPLRSTLGKYLNERYQSIASVLVAADLLEIVKGEVIRADWEKNEFKIVINDGREYMADELVLTIGHQPTRNSEQLSTWLKYSGSNHSVVLKVSPYPVKDILKSKKSHVDSVVGLRGFGLAMIDVMRALTVGLGGAFRVVDEDTQEMKYVKSGNEPAKIIPFSLDGLPMAPKPLNLAIDELYFPTDTEKKDFQDAISHISKRGEAKSHTFLIAAITPITCRVFFALGDKAYAHNLKETAISEIIRLWLENPDYEHELIVAKTNPTVTMVEEYVGMATSTVPVSLDFCIGHVWRHCQPSLYQATSYSNLKDEVIASIIQLDERLKRYSYGPPVASLQQLLALVRADVISLEYVNDPDIQTNSNGWKLANDEETVIVDFMVNSVLDAPKLLEVDSPIIHNFLEESLLKPIHGELGIETYKNGCVILDGVEKQIPLAVLGRLAKGTLIGVDAILECFGERSKLWALGVIKRLKFLESTGMK